MTEAQYVALMEKLEQMRRDINDSLKKLTEQIARIAGRIPR